MSNISFDLTGKLPAEQLELLACIQAAANRLSLPLLLVGATVRDLFLHHLYGKGIRRATYDLDLTVQTKTWQQFLELRQSLLDSGKFKPSRYQQQLYWQEGARTKVDLVPFGGLEAPPGQITWPGEDFVMSTTGFSEVQGHAVALRLAANLVIQAASLEGLALLKIVSWGDRPQERRRDAQDLDWLLDEYLDIIQDEQLFSERAAHADLLDEEFDSLTAGARILGRNIGHIASAATRQKLLAILAAENQRSGITVLANTAEQLRSRFANTEQALVRWRELLRGIRESEAA